MKDTETKEVKKKIINRVELLKIHDSTISNQNSDFLYKIIIDIEGKAYEICANEGGFVY